MTPAEALQRALAHEHAAVWTFSMLGGRTSASEQGVLFNRLQSAYTAHRERRDQLTALLRAMDEEPVASALAYRLPTAADTVEEVRQAALATEQAAAAAYADAVGGTEGEQRAWAVDALTDSAVRSLGFGARPERFPGAAEL